jgi:hypothetical protein
LHSFVVHKHDGRQRNNTMNQPKSWMAVDLGKGRSLVPHHYCLRQGLSDSFRLRTWRLEGSNDEDPYWEDEGQEKWTTLREHSNDDSFPRQAHSVAHWIVGPSPPSIVSPSFRHFRIVQTGRNSDGTHYNVLSCAGIELYGELRLG